MGKLDGKVAVITGGTSGMALASAKLFVEEGAHVFITGRRQEALDEAVKLIGRNVTGVRGDAANLDDLDRLFDGGVKREKGQHRRPVCERWHRRSRPTRRITEQHFDATFGLNTRGTLFTVQKALPLFNDGGSIFMTGSVASLKGFPGYSVYAASKAALHAFARGWLNEVKGRNIRVNVLHPGPIATPMQDQVLTEEAKHTAEARGFYAAALAASGDRANALLQYQQALAVLLSSSRGSEDDQGSVAGRQRRLRFILEELSSPADRSTARWPATVPDAAEAFRIADAARGQALQQALVASAARAAVHDSGLSDLVRREQDALRQISALNAVLAAALAVARGSAGCGIDPARCAARSISCAAPVRAAAREPSSSAFPITSA